MRKSLTIGVTMLALVAVLVTGALLYASQGAATPKQPAAKPAATANQELNVQDPSYIGSISVPGNVSDQALAGLAKITVSDAEKAALAKFPGATVLKTELDNENGYLVYSVELQTTNGFKDVKVDAGNAQILYVGTGGANEAAEYNAEKAEGAETESAQEAPEASSESD